MDKYSRLLIGLVPFTLHGMAYAGEIITTPGLYVVGGDIVDTSTGTKQRLTSCQQPR